MAPDVLAALVTRRAARDAFDAWQLLERVPDLLARPELRLAFVVQIAGSRHDARRLDPRVVTVSMKEVRDSLLPLLRVEGRPLDGDVEATATRVNAAALTVSESLLDWTGPERPAS